MMDSVTIDRECRLIADAATVSEVRVAVAESLTGGNIAAQLSRAPNSVEWFCGGIVAYRPEVKHGLLGVPDGPVVCARAAEAMAANTARLLGADLVVAVTGEAGPSAQEEPPGTVCFGLFDRGEVSSSDETFDGEPEDIVTATVAHALRLVRARVDGDRREIS